MIMFWLGRRFALAVAAVLLLVGRRGSPAAAEHAAGDDRRFRVRPGTLTVKRGTTVTWTNKDDEPHTVVSEADPKLWKSPPLDTDDSFSFTFNEAGTYKYFCSVHPRMQGTVVVE